MVLDKIDLSTIDSSTRPKKTTKKKEEAAPAASVAKTADAEGVTAKKAAAAETSAKAATPAEATAKATASAEALAKTEGPEVNADENAPVITNIRAEKLEGPKILGKIDFPTSGDTRSQQPTTKKDSANAYRSRERIRPCNEMISSKEETTPQRPARTGWGIGHSGGGATFRPGQNRSGPGQHRPAASGPRPAFLPREQKEIDKKEIQDKIRETQAKLAGSGGRGKSLKAKYRRAKRDEVAEHAGGEELQDNKLQLTEFISVSELANLMDVSYAEVIGKCMSLGLMVSINQRLDAEVIELVASEFGFDVEFIDMEKQLEMEEMEEEDDG